MSGNQAVSVEGLKEQLESAFIAAFKAGVTAFQDAGDALAKLVDVDPEALERIQKKYGHPVSILRTLLDVGRGKLLPQLFAAETYVKALPVADQRRLVEGQVEALVLKPDGSTDKIKVDVMSSPAALVRQVIGRAGIRSFAEQRARLVSEANASIAEKQAREKKPHDMPWHVSGKTVVVTEGVRLTQKDLAAMMQAIS